MSRAIIRAVTVQLGGDNKTVEVIAELLEGQVTAGMNVGIELNHSMSVLVPVIQVTKLGDNKVKLTLDAEDEEDAAFIKALNFEDETLIVSISSMT